MSARTRETPEQAHRRNYQACTGCRSKKLRCNRGDPDQPSTGPCRRCARESKECIVGPTEYRVKRKKVKEDDGGSVSNAPGSSNVPLHDPRLTPLLNALSAAPLPTVSRAGPSFSHSPSTDNQLLSFPPSISPHQHQQPRSPGETRLDNTEEGDAVVSTMLSNPSDAFKMLVTASNKINSTSPNALGSTTSIAIAEFGDWEPVKEGVLEREEAEILLRYFVTTLSPLYPLLPAETLAASRLPTLLTTESLLLLTVLAISARYLSISALSPAGEPNASSSVCARSAQIHVALASLVREDLAGISEGEPELRKVSTVEAMLLLSEWPLRPATKRKRARDQALEDLSEVDRAVRTSNVYDSLSWSYIGSAVRLAQELGLSDRARYSVDAEAAAGSPDAWESVRDLRAWAYSYNADQHVSCRLGRNAVVQRFMSSDWWENMGLLTAKQSATQGIPAWSPQLAYSQASVAALVATIHDRLYPSKEVTKVLLRTGQWEPFLHSLRVDIDHHRRKSIEVLSSGTLDSELLSIEFDYVLLYGYAIALRALQERVARMRARHDQIQVTLLNLSEGSWIIDAMTAASSILTISVTSLHTSGLLRLSPARLFERILFAASFLLKALALGVVEHGRSNTSALLRQTVDALTQHSVDFDHVSHGFASLLRKLVDQIQPVETQAPSREASVVPIAQVLSSLGQQPSHESAPLNAGAGNFFSSDLINSVDHGASSASQPLANPNPDFDVFAGWPMSLDSTPFLNSQAQDTLFQELWATDQGTSSLSLMDTLGSIW